MSPDRTGEEIAELEARIEELEQQVDGQQSGDISMSRRGVLGSLVGAGAAGAALGSLSEPASAQSSPVGQLGSDSDRIDLYGSTVDTEALEAGRINTVEVADGSRGIQAAHDSLDGFGMVFISDDYDISQDTLPIQISKPGVYAAANTSNPIDASGITDTNVIEIDLTGMGPDEYSIFRNLRVQGGKHCFHLSGITNTTMEHCIADTADQHGFYFPDDGEDVNSNHFRRLMARDCGEDGIHLAPGGAIYNYFDFCQFISNDGHGFYEDGRYVNHVRYSNFHQNGEHDIRLDGLDSSASIGNYFESEGSGYHIRLDCRGGTIEGNLFDGDPSGDGPQKDVACRILGERTTFRNNTGRNLNYMVETGSTASDSDLYLSTNIPMEDFPVLNESLTDSVKSHGTRGAAQLGGSNIEFNSGSYHGETAVSDGGSSSADVEGSLWWWDESGTQWVRVDGQETVTPS